jgi:hypothetical protein
MEGNLILITSFLLAPVAAADVWECKTEAEGKPGSSQPARPSGKQQASGN